MMKKVKKHERTTPHINHMPEICIFGQMNNGQIYIVLIAGSLIRQTIYMLLR